MLIICGLICGPRVKRENGIETAMPGCKMKFELSRRKKTRRKTTSSNGKRTSQPKLYSFVRLSFIDLFGGCRSYTCLPRRSLGEGGSDLTVCPRLGFAFLRLLKADDPAKRPALCQHMHDLDAGAFHFVQHRVYARRKLTIRDK